MACGFPIHLSDRNGPQLNVFFLVPAAIVATPAVIMARNVLEVRRWIRVPGVVLSTELEVMTYPQSPARSYSPIVRYAYKVDGKDHCGDVLTHGMTAGSNRSSAQRVIDRYPPGSPVTVLHHPTQPEKACLEASFGFFGWVLAVLASVLSLLAVVT